MKVTFVLKGQQGIVATSECDSLDILLPEKGDIIAFIGIEGQPYMGALAKVLGLYTVFDVQSSKTFLAIACAVDEELALDVDFLSVL
ncbi:hypothetical protein NIES4106_61310 (plasmid) [Fischerella sp. NIES-4106]|nr:hypothetical protein NIES4106_61310 [Fischerella sp. NIES-4106]